LGLNAHINYDLAYGIYLNLKEHNDQSNHLLLPRRKFEHDQINNILVRCIPKISETLARDYGGGIVLISRVMRNLDEMLTESGLKYYRERVWWNAISYLATVDEREIYLVHDRLNWESAKVANALGDDTIGGHRAAQEAVRQDRTRRYRRRDDCQANFARGAIAVLAQGSQPRHERLDGVRRPRLTMPVGC
jgi:hypothetical protein